MAKGYVKTPDEAIAAYVEGVRGAVQKYVTNAERVGAPKLRRFFDIALPAHANAWRAGQYRAVLVTDADRLGNVQQSWAVSRSAAAQYRQTLLARVAAAVPVIA
ncbi:MAG: hypothetical protein QXF58_05235 [Desulfurococcaceae archaeon]